MGINRVNFQLKTIDRIDNKELVQQAKVAYELLVNKGRLVYQAKIMQEALGQEGFKAFEGAYQKAEQTFLDVDIEAVNKYVASQINAKQLLQVLGVKEPRNKERIEEIADMMVGKVLRTTKNIDG